MVVALHFLALVLYLAAVGLLVGSLYGRRWGAPRLGSLLAGAGVMAHGAGLAAFAVAFGELPLVGLAPSLSVLGFLIGAFLLAAAAFGDARTLGLVLVPQVAVLLIASLALGIEPTGELLAFRGLWLVFHTMLAFLGYAGLAVAFAAGLVYLLQFREIKGKRLGRIFRFFPSLETLDQVGWWSLAIGFPALTLGLLVGWAWAARFDQPLTAGDPKVIWGVLTWVTFAGAIASRAGGAARNRRSALVAVVGFLLVVVVYVLLRALETRGGAFL
jgi:ABC-type transport system involved in cytochrome c biogenesis permease subunit